MELQTHLPFRRVASFALYLGIAFWARAGSTSDFYVAGGGVHPITNGMATAADWMSAASFISMAGLISNMGYGGAVFLMGWTGGYVLLACLLAPYLRKFGKFTVPEFIGDRFYSQLCPQRGRALPAGGFADLHHRPDDRRGRDLRALPGRVQRSGHLHRHGHRVRLRRVRRHEGHHLHPGGAVHRADPGLPGAGVLHLPEPDRQLPAAAGPGLSWPAPMCRCWPSSTRW
jgi:hypothetical protein